MKMSAGIRRNIPDILKSVKTLPFLSMELAITVANSLELRRRGLQLKDKKEGVLQENN